MKVRRLHDGHLRCLRVRLHHHAQPKPYMDTEAGRLLRRVAHHLAGGHHLIPQDLPGR